MEWQTETVEAERVVSLLTCLQPKRKLNYRKLAKLLIALVLVWQLFTSMIGAIAYETEKAARTGAAFSHTKDIL